MSLEKNILQVASRKETFCPLAVYPRFSCASSACHLLFAHSPKLLYEVKLAVQVCSIIFESLIWGSHWASLASWFVCRRRWFFDRVKGFGETRRICEILFDECLRSKGFSKTCYCTLLVELGEVFLLNLSPPETLVSPKIDSLPLFRSKFWHHICRWRRGFSSNAGIFRFWMMKATCSDREDGQEALIEWWWQKSDGVDGWKMGEVRLSYLGLASLYQPWDGEGRQHTPILVKCLCLYFFGALESGHVIKIPCMQKKSIPLISEIVRTVHMLTERGVIRAPPAKLPHSNRSTLH